MTTGARLRVFLTCAAAIFGTACGQSVDSERVYRFVDSENYESEEAWLESSQNTDSIRAALPYDSIALERFPCPWGQCPTYRIALATNGSASYVGHANVPQDGISSAEVDLQILGRVYQRISKLVRTDALTEPSDEVVREDGWEWALTIWLKTGETATYTGFYGDGPSEAWELRSAIDGLLVPLAWSRSEAQE